jgi:cytochrome c oxidase subunit III
MTDYIAGGRRVSEVPRTTVARGDEGVARALSMRVGRPAALWGMAVLIASEATLFGCMIGTYFFLRFSTRVWPPDGIPRPAVVGPLVSALLLASSSIPMQLASDAGRHGRAAAARLYVLTALVIQTGYFAYAVHDYSAQIHTFDITRDAYSSIYYTVLGADHAHILVGLLFNVWLLWKLARGLTTYRVNALQAITWYWHAVNIITLVVTATLLSAA